MALVAAAMLLVELIVTRVFSVLFFYHYSFFAVSLVMSGLTLGGLLASRWNVRSATADALATRLGNLATLFALGALLGMGTLIATSPMTRVATPSLPIVAIVALCFVPGLTAAGAFLAAAFARRESWIDRLYAADLAAASSACLAAIFILRWLQGPGSLLAPALLAALAALALSRRTLPALVAVACVAAMIANVATDGRFLRLPIDGKLLFERWNEHSRVIVSHGGDNPPMRAFVIDKSAATYMRGVGPREPGAPLPKMPWWSAGITNVAYGLGRPLHRSAIIGVGGGRDLLAPLGVGVEHVDGYEINGIIVDLLTHRFTDFNDVATWPEVSIFHGEARVGIAHSGHRYDSIQASLIDTWAATAAGGFVLSENGLYTVDGWRTFYRSLSDTGVLTMTRWYLPQAPAEMQRLCSLAAATLIAEGVPDPAAHIAIVSPASEKEVRALDHTQVTIVLSKPPFSPAEIQKLQAKCARDHMHLIAAPGLLCTDATVDALMDPARRREAIANSPFDISAPTDARPYFFLQLRPQDLLWRGGSHADYALNLTFKAVRVMGLLGVLSLLITVLVLVLTARTSRRESAAATPAFLFGASLYFLGAGVGYMLVQLGLHQRLILILGHPTYALSVVLFAMLLGTGAGSLLSRRLSPSAFPRAWIAVLAVLGTLVLCSPLIPLIEAFASSLARSVVAGLLAGVVGLALGFVFPLGVRLVGPLGDHLVARMWAVNGAASIAGSTLAAVLGVAFGSRVVLLAGLFVYGLVFLGGTIALRSRPPEPAVVA